MERPILGASLQIRQEKISWRECSEKTRSFSPVSRVLHVSGGFPGARAAEFSLLGTLGAGVSEGTVFGTAALGLVSDRGGCGLRCAGRCDQEVECQQLSIEVALDSMETSLSEILGSKVHLDALDGSLNSRPQRVALLFGCEVLRMVPVDMRLVCAMDSDVPSLP